MTQKKMTVLFIAVMFIGIAGYDVYTIAVGGVETSISHTMIEWSYKYPIFTFMMGVICGHLFWRMSDTPFTKRMTEFIKAKDDKKE